MFTPELSATALKTMRGKFGERVYGRYGFVDAFNPNTNWTDTDVIGINVGIIFLSAENARTGNVWRWFMRNKEIPLAMQRVGLARSQRNNHKVENHKSGRGQAVVTHIFLHQTLSAPPLNSHYNDLSN
jgi:hypothetical protein